MKEPLVATQLVFEDSAGSSSVLPRTPESKNETESVNVFKNTFDLIDPKRQRSMHPFQPTPGGGIPVSPLTLTGGGFKKRDSKIIAMKFTLLRLKDDNRTIFGLAASNAYLVRDYLKQIGGKDLKIFFWF